VYYRLFIAQKLLRSDSWTTGDRNIDLLLAGKWPNDTKHVLVTSGFIFNFGQKRFTGKVHRTNEDSTKHRSTETEANELRF